MYLSFEIVESCLNTVVSRPNSGFPLFIFILFSFFISCFLISFFFNYSVLLQFQNRWKHKDLIHVHTFLKNEGIFFFSLKMSVFVQIFSWYWTTDSNHRVTMCFPSFPGVLLIRPSAGINWYSSVDSKAICWFTTAEILPDNVTFFSCVPCSL